MVGFPYFQGATGYVSVREGINLTDFLEKYTIWHRYQKNGRLENVCYFSEYRVILGIYVRFLRVCVCVYTPAKKPFRYPFFLGQPNTKSDRYLS